MNEYMYKILVCGIVQQIRNAMGPEYWVHMKDLSEAYHDSYYEHMVCSDPIKAVLDKLEHSVNEGEET